MTDARWRKSSYSGNNNGNCVEVAGVLATIAVRDSKDPDGAKLAVAPAAWAAFTRSVKTGAPLA